MGCADDSATTKWCAKCACDKPVSEFYPRLSRGPNVYNTNCKICDRESNRAWREANREARLVYYKTWRAANLESCKAYDVLRWQKPEVKAARKANIQASPERHSGYWRTYRLRHPDKIRVSTNRWRAANPDKMRATWHRRRTAKASSEGSWTKEDIERIRLHQRNKCACCRVSFRKTGCEVDHIKPLARGGSNWPSNLQLMCKSCNSRKQAQDPLVFMRKQGRLL